MSRQRKIVISVPCSMLEELDKFACAQCRSRSDLVREAVSAYLKETELARRFEQMKKGYLEMGHINLAIACEWCNADTMALCCYEENLSESE